MRRFNVGNARGRRGRGGGGRGGYPNNQPRGLGPSDTEFLHMFSPYNVAQASLIMQVRPLSRCNAVYPGANEGVGRTV